jgi:hypothetical protein
MLSIFRTRHSAYFNFAFLFAVLGSWLFFYLQPVLRGFLSDEYLFYGKVSYAAIPSIFGNSDIPLLDKTLFRLNGDNDATFILYASKEILEEMSEWFQFGARNAGDISLEVSAARVGENRFVVSSMATSNGALEWDTLMEYQFQWAMIYLVVELVFFCGFVFFIVLGFRSRRRWKALERKLMADRDSSGE